MNSILDYIRSLEEPEEPGVDEFKAAQGRYPGAAERRVIAEQQEQKPRFAQEGLAEPEHTYSNYMTGPGYKLPKGMPMMGSEPRKETEQEHLIRQGATDVVGHDPHRSAWERTVKEWNGWFDILGGESTPDNPEFRKTYGNQFDEDFKKYLSEEMSKRTAGMEKLQKLSDQFRESRGEVGADGVFTPAEGGDLLQTLGIKNLPGPKSPRDYQDGVPDAEMASHRTLKRQELADKAKIDRETKAAEKAQTAEQKAWISKNTTAVNRAYSELKSTVDQKIASWKQKRAEAMKHYRTGESGWENYLDSYERSIAQLEAFREKFPDYLDADRTAINQGQDPVNWPQVKKYWSNAIIKYNR